MRLQKKRIRDITPYLHHIQYGNKIIVGISSIGYHKAKLTKIGFPHEYKSGQTILPAIVGPVSRYNAEGKELIHKDLPMETAYRQTDWEWQEWDGTWYSKIVDVPYKRYPRSFIPPPAVELTFIQNANGESLLVSPAIEKNEINKEKLTHVVNLFLEIFGECQFFTDNLDIIEKTHVVRLNWEIFPQGEVPWEKLEKHIVPIVKKAPDGNQPVIMSRLETINKMQPDFIAIGKGGFYGYIVHGFTAKNLFVLESIFYGNATYVFGETWEVLSQRTKAEIINEKLQQARVIHREGWTGKIIRIT